MLLLTSRGTRAIALTALPISMAIVYWMLSLRESILDITFEKIFLGLFLFQDHWLSLAGFLILTVALFGPLGKLALRCVDLIGRNVNAVASVYFLILCVGALGIYHAHPLSMDEYAPYFQSQIFANAELAGHLPPSLIDWLIPPGFQNYFLNVSHADGRVVSSYWPGFALLLTPFTLLGVPWMCNPLLGALALLLMHRLARRLYDDERAAGLAVLLTMMAPVFAANAISFYSMNAHMVFNAAFALLLFDSTPRRAFWAGVIGSFALALHNPVPHTLFAAPWILSLLAQRRWPAVGALILGYLPLVLLLGLGWAIFSAGIAEPRIAVEGSAIEGWVTRLGEIFRLPDSTLLYARLIASAKLWIWAVPASFVAACLTSWRLWDDARIRLLTYSALVTLVGYLIVPFDQGHGWGYRYFHSAWFVAPLLAAGVAGGSPAASTGRLQDQEPAGYLAACGLLSGLVLVPLAAALIEQFMSRHLAQLPVADSGAARLIIVHANTGYYAGDLVQNDPYARNGVLRLYSHGKDRDRLMLEREFPDLTQLARDTRGSVWGTAEK